MGYLRGMRRFGALVFGAALLGLLLALYAARFPKGEPEVALPPAATPGLATESPPEEGRQSAPTPQLRAAPPPEPGGSVVARPLEPVESDPAAIPLEKLLNWEQARPAPRGLDLGRAAQPETGAPTGGPGVRDRVYLERRTEELDPSDKERKLQTTDVGVRLPVGESVEVRSGVRIESRQDGESEAAEAAPTVGVGVRF